MVNAIAIVDNELMDDYRIAHERLGEWADVKFWLSPKVGCSRLTSQLKDLWPFDLLLVCGEMSQATYELVSCPQSCRIIECPHPAARFWDRKSLAFMRRLVREGKQSLSVEMHHGQLVAFPLIPF